MPTCQHELIGVPAPAYLPTLVGIGPGLHAPVVSWAAGRHAGGSRLRLLDGAADRTDRNRLELLGGVAEATGRSWPVSCPLRKEPSVAHRICAPAHFSTVAIIHEGGTGSGEWRSGGWSRPSRGEWRGCQGRERSGYSSGC
jgi:hypothetical protein